MFGAKIKDNVLETIRRKSVSAVAYDIKMFAEFSEEEISAYTAARYIAYQKQTEQFLRNWCVITSDVEWTTGIGAPDTDFQRVTEGGITPMTAGAITEYKQGAFINRFQKKFGWTKDALQYMTLADFNNELEGHFRGDRRNIFRSIVRAVFKATSTTARDIDGDKRTLTQYPIANGDSRTYPVTWNGQNILSAHTHFLARIGGSWAVADMDAAAATIYEHHPGSEVEYYVGWNSGGLVSALTGFTAVTPVTIVPGANTAVLATSVRGTQQDETSLEPVLLGMYNNKKVYKAWWIPDNYMITALANISDITRRPLRFRVPKTPYFSEEAGGRLPMALSRSGNDQPGRGGLQVIMDGSEASIFDVTMSVREFGVSSNYPLSMAVSYMAGGAYVEPTITAN